jgi:succinate-semialdehyde dehydrogenase/glutarate-semialdehyde dehydrogenase
MQLKAPHDENLAVASGSLSPAWRVAETPEYGMIGISGSHHGIEEFVELKYVMMGGLEG